VCIPAIGAHALRTTAMIHYANIFLAAIVPLIALLLLTLLGYKPMKSQSGKELTGNWWP
jgi:hypothetical protein